MRFRHNLTGNNTIKRVVSFLLMLCLLVPMLPSSIGLDAKAEDNTTTETAESTNGTVTITLHDLYIDRKEALPDDTKLDNCLLAYKSARTITVEKGTTLSDALADKNVELGTKSLAGTGVYKEGTEDDKAMTSVINASKCVWYTRDGGTNGGVDGNNARHLFSSDTVINDDLNLYTYSYRIRLITGKKQYQDLIVREGQKEGFIAGNRNDIYEISDFLKSNSTEVTSWTDVNEDAEADTSALANGITRNYAFRASGVDKNEITIACYASVNETWKQVGSITMDKDRVDVWGRTGPALNYYVTDEELESVYGKEYDFAKSMLKTQTEISKEINGYFPFRNGGNMIIRQMPKQVEGGTEFRVPLVEDTTTDVSNLEIYYTPHNTTEYTSNFLEYAQNDAQHNNRYGWASTNDSAVLQDNSFYTVSIDESDKDKFNSSELLDAKLLRGESGSFELPLTAKDNSKVQWYVEEGGDNVTIKNDEDTATVTVDGIDSQLILTTDKNKEYAGDVQVHCYALVNGKPQEVGKLHTCATYKAYWGQNKYYNKYYVTAKQAAIVYGKYGFDVSKFDPNTNQQQKYIFANTKHNDATIWMDLVPCDSDDGMGYKIPLLASDSSEEHMDLYYVPNNAKSGSVTVSGTSADSTFVQKNSFYSVTVKDEAQVLGNPQLPETQYVLYGETTEVTVPSSKSATWSIWNCFLDGEGTTPVNEHSDYESSSTENDQITYTVKNICRPILVTTSTEHKESLSNLQLTALQITK